MSERIREAFENDACISHDYGNKIWDKVELYYHDLNVNEAWVIYKKAWESAMESAMQSAQEEIDRLNDVLKEAMRQAYLTGIHDKENDVDAWCEQGSVERIEELLKDGLLKDLTFVSKYWEAKI